LERRSKIKVKYQQIKKPGRVQGFWWQSQEITPKAGATALKLHRQVGSPTTA
jgi:hypothetical protein